MDKIIKECPICKEEYTIRSEYMLQLYSRACPVCCHEIGKMVYKCDLCGAIHFHQFQNCSKCPGKTVARFVFGKNRQDAWRKAGKLPNQGDW